MEVQILTQGFGMLGDNSDTKEFEELILDLYKTLRLRMRSLIILPPILPISRTRSGKNALVSWLGKPC